MELQQLQQIYLEHLLRIGLQMQQAEKLLQDLTQEQLLLICQILPATEHGLD